MITLLQIDDLRSHSPRIVVCFGHEGELDDPEIAQRLRRHFGNMLWQMGSNNRGFDVAIATDEPMAALLGIGSAERAGEVVKTIVEVFTKAQR